MQLPDLKRITLTQQDIKPIDPLQAIDQLNEEGIEFLNFDHFIEHKLSHTNSLDGNQCASAIFSIHQPADDTQQEQNQGADAHQGTDIECQRWIRVMLLTVILDEVVVLCDERKLEGVACWQGEVLVWVETGGEF